MMDHNIDLIPDPRMPKGVIAFIGPPTEKHPGGQVLALAKGTVYDFSDDLGRLRDEVLTSFRAEVRGLHGPPY